MVDRSPAAVREKLTDLISGILRKNSINRPVEAEANLTSLGLISVDMVELMLAVEAAFDIAIPQSGITPENFRSIVTIETMITKLTQNAEQSAVSCA